MTTPNLWLALPFDFRAGKAGGGGAVAEHRVLGGLMMPGVLLSGGVLSLEAKGRGLQAFGSRAFCQ